MHSLRYLLHTQRWGRAPNGREGALWIHFDCWKMLTWVLISKLSQYPLGAKRCRNLMLKLWMKMLNTTAVKELADSEPAGSTMIPPTAMPGSFGSYQSPVSASSSLIARPCPVHLLSQGPQTKNNSENKKSFIARPCPVHLPCSARSGTRGIPCDVKTFNRWTNAKPNTLWSVKVEVEGCA